MARRWIIMCTLAWGRGARPVSLPCRSVGKIGADGSPARPAACNRCPIKARCTDSDTGREVVRSLDPWPQSEIAHVHRGVSLLLLGLAGFVAIVGMLRYHADDDLVVLGISIVTTAATFQRLLPGFVDQRLNRFIKPRRDWKAPSG